MKNCEHPDDCGVFFLKGMLPIIVKCHSKLAGNKLLNNNYNSSSFFFLSSIFTSPPLLAKLLYSQNSYSTSPTILSVTNLLYSSSSSTATFPSAQIALLMSSISCLDILPSATARSIWTGSFSSCRVSSSVGCLALDRETNIVAFS